GCSHRATWRIQNRRGSSRRWMKVQWQVSPPLGPGHLVRRPRLSASSAGFCASCVIAAEETKKALNPLMRVYF
ncbi:hypothetical protein E0J21_19735, partial [Rhizobium laguerreae]